MVGKGKEVMAEEKGRPQAFVIKAAGKGSG